MGDTGNFLRTVKGLPQMGLINTLAASQLLQTAIQNGQELELPRASSGSARVIIDLFAGVNPINVWLQDVYGSQTPIPIPLPGNAFYSFAATGLNELIVGSTLASSLTIICWTQTDLKDAYNPMSLIESGGTAT